MFSLETPRLMIGPHTRDSIDVMLRWWNDPDMVFLNDDYSDLFQPVTRRDMARMIDDFIFRTEAGNGLEFTIRRKDSGQMIGAGDLYDLDRHHRRCKIGINIGEKTQWGYGYAHEALAVVLDYAFPLLNLNRISAEIYCFNERSIRLFRSLGFQHEGTARQTVLKNGKFYDDCLFGLLRTDWDNQHHHNP